MQGPLERDFHKFRENDDEAERMARREQDCLSAWSRESSLNFSKLPNNTPSHAEMHEQIVRCLKLSAENKINEKNAFQLHMIDFLSYSLAKQDDKVSNLQMASACLDASSKIYGYRVDKVHFELMKVVGHGGEKREHSFNGNDYDESNERKRKRRRKNYHILSSVESLKGNLDTYNPLSLINTQNDIQTSDMLFQASLPQHANQGIALNLYRDVLLDRVPSDKYNITKALTSLIDDFTADHLCPSFAEFKFLGWLPEEELDLDQETVKPINDDEDSDYHFNLDDPISDSVNNNVMNHSDITENSNGLVQNVLNGKDIVDFQDIIANNPSTDCEYSYMEPNHKIDWNGPSHWKVKLMQNDNEIGKPLAKKKHKNNMSLSYSRKLKEVTCTRNYITRKRMIVNASKWSEDKNASPPNSEDQDSKQFYEYFLKSGEPRKLSENGIMEEQCSDIRAQENLDLDNSLDLSKFNDSGISFDADTTEEHDCTQQLKEDNNLSMPSSQKSFEGNNLVPIPSMIPKIFIPYSQRAKRINMNKINKATEEILQKMEDENEIVKFSQIYHHLPKVLPKLNAESLSVGLSFVSLLHIVHKKNLDISSQNNLCDLVINCHKENA